MTGTQVITRYPFYSVDSSSWLYGIQFAMAPIFENGKLSYYYFNKEDEYAKGVGKGHRFYQKHTDDRKKQSNMVLQDSVKSFAQYAKYITDLCFWLCFLIRA